jgi:glycosyltransferase involved in cell wall biosynthesis
MIIITIPAYNEAKSIGTVISDIKKVMKKEKEEFKIIVVDDGSKDKTKEVAEKEGAIVFRYNYNRGLAATFRTEMSKCLELNADIIVHTDADGQYQAEDILKLINKVREGYDLVLGNRFRGGIEGMPFLKKLGNKAFSRTISKIIGFRVGDCQTGFRAFTRDVAEKIEITSNHTYTQEQIIKAVRQGYKIKEIPSFFGKREGKSRLMKSPLEYAVKAWINILRIQRDYNPIKFFGSFGLLFIVLGLILGVYLVSLFLIYGRIGHLPLTILTMLLIMVGIQISLFGFLADTGR